MTTTGSPPHATMRGLMLASGEPVRSPLVTHQPAFWLSRRVRRPSKIYWRAT